MNGTSELKISIVFSSRYGLQDLFTINYNILVRSESTSMFMFSWREKIFKPFLHTQVGQSIRFFNNVNSNEKINEDTVKKIQQVFGKTYPQAAIDKYINVVRQLHSQVPEENEAGNVSVYKTKQFFVSK